MFCRLRLVSCPTHLLPKPTLQLRNLLSKRRNNRRINRVIESGSGIASGTASVIASGSTSMIASVTATVNTNVITVETETATETETETVTEIENTIMIDDPETWIGKITMIAHVFVASGSAIESMGVPGIVIARTILMGMILRNSALMMADGLLYSRRVGIVAIVNIL